MNFNELDLLQAQKDGIISVEVFNRLIEYLKSSILVVRFYDELNLKILNEIIGKIKKKFGKKV